MTLTVALRLGLERSTDYSPVLTLFLHHHGIAVGNSHTYHNVIHSFSLFTASGVLLNNSL